MWKQANSWLQEKADVLVGKALDWYLELVEDEN